MHATDVDDVTFHHNGDYSGDVHIVVEPSMVETYPGSVYVTVPFEALKTLVADWARQKRISELEQASPDEVLMVEV